MSGFSAILGNPPWEVLSMEEKSWFASANPDIANARNAAGRKRLIEALEKSDSETDNLLFQKWKDAVRASMCDRKFLAKSGNYPFSGIGKLNLFALFTEHFRIHISHRGRIGCVIQTNILTHATYNLFLHDILGRGSLFEALMFENMRKIFPAVDHRFKFALFSMTGSSIRNSRPMFSALSWTMEQALSEEYRFSLSQSEIETINPNTRNIPMFRHSRDAAITLTIHSQTPPFWRELGDENPWGIQFLQMYNMASSSHQFSDFQSLEESGFNRDGYDFISNDGDIYTPLYEGKMIWLYDHRYGTYEGQTVAQSREGILPKVTDICHQNPSYIPLHRYWVEKDSVEDTLISRDWEKRWMLTFRDVGPSERTMIPSVVPRAASGHKTPVMLMSSTSLESAFLLANMSSIPCDFAIRQKTSNSLAFFVVKQAPVFPPPRDDDPTPWQGDTLLGYVVPRVLELTYTSHDLKGWAEDLGHTGPPFAWDPPRRRQLQAELDALFFHLYQLNREQVEWVLDSFRVLREKEEKSPEKGGFGEFLTKRLVMEAWDAMDYAIRMQKRFEPPWVSEEHRLQRMLTGENLYIEYKQNIKKNLKEGAKNNTRDSWLKSVAGFANREGGTILIGVAEDENQRGVPVGYEEKYREDPDGAVQAVVQITEVVLGGYAASLLDVEARTIDDAPVLEVTVHRGEEPIWANLFGKGSKIYIRQPNRVGVLEGEELIKYARERWGEEVAKGLHD